MNDVNLDTSATYFPWTLNCLNYLTKALNLLLKSAAQQFKL